MYTPLRYQGQGEPLNWETQKGTAHLRLPTDRISTQQIFKLDQKFLCSKGIQKYSKINFGSVIHTSLWYTAGTPRKRTTDQGA